jgi:hypothetical protein
VGGNSPGVVGTSDNSAGGHFENNVADFPTLELVAENASGFVLDAFDVANNAYCDIDAHGNLSCTGTKNAVVPLDGGARTVALSAIESPKNWFEDFGSSQLANGSVVVSLDPDFTQTVNTELEYHVFLTPKGDCKGLYVSQQTPGSFEVHELGGGTSTVAFSYRVVALRKKYEDVRFADHTDDAVPRKRMERMKSARPLAPASHKTPTQLVPLPEAKLAPIPATTVTK